MLKREKTFSLGETFFYFSSLHPLKNNIAKNPFYPRSSSARLISIPVLYSWFVFLLFKPNAIKYILRKVYAIYCFEANSILDGRQEKYISLKLSDSLTVGVSRSSVAGKTVQNDYRFCKWTPGRVLTHDLREAITLDLVRREQRIMESTSLNQFACSIY